MRTTHIITGMLDDEGVAGEPVVECLNDANDPTRDCRHGAEAPDCEYAGTDRPDGDPPTYPCGGFYHSEAVGQHIHPYDAETRGEDPCAFKAWWSYTGMAMSEVDWRKGRPELPVAGHIEWTDYDPMFVPHEEPTQRPLMEIFAERVAQDAKWGQQNHPDGTGMDFDEGVPELAQAYLEKSFEDGNGTWRLVLSEEIAEAYAESDPVLLRGELVQVAAVAVAWIEAIDRRA